MADREVLVHLDRGGRPQLVGRLWAHVRRGRESATFVYDPDWLRGASRFSLEPALPLGSGTFHTEPDRAMFGAFGDSAPDRWGRVLMRRAERQRAAAAKEHPRTLYELDYLLMVDDEARQGALRFASAAGGPLLASASARIPPMVALPRLLAAAEHVTGDEGTAEDLRVLLAPGSSLGGARPKASVRDRDGQLAIAKFPHTSDEWNVVTWEAVALELARQSGISVPDSRLETVAGKPVLILRRFDRSGKDRVPFLSALAMLGARDHELRSYLEFADILREQGAQPKRDMAEVWRRIVFNVLASNTDDHLRNHGFLYIDDSGGWRLSPAYDLNPVPTDVKPRVLSTAIDPSDSTASLALALEVADYFELTPAAAKEIVGEVGRAVRQWREQAARLGVARPEVERMTSAFEHEDARTAVRMGQ